MSGRQYDLEGIPICENCGQICLRCDETNFNGTYCEKCDEFVSSHYDDSHPIWLEYNKWIKNNILEDENNPNKLIGIFDHTFKKFKEANGITSQKI